jgi:hypothetical protein
MLALSPARSVYNNANATQSQVDTAVARLQSAIDALVIPEVLTIDRAALRSAIVEAESRVQANYTPASWAQMMLALSPARSTYNNANATQAQIDAAVGRLQPAIDSLVLRP